MNEEPVDINKWQNSDKENQFINTSPKTEKKKRPLNEVKIYKITIPSQRVTLDNFRPTWNKRQKRKTSKPKKYRTECGEEEEKDFFLKDYGDLDDPSKVEERKKDIKWKLSLNQDHCYFSKLEEAEIHQRAEMYSSSVPPDPDFYVLPTNEMQESSNQCQTSVFSYRILEQEKRKKRRNYMKEYYYLTPNIGSSCSKLSYGTKLLKPPDKLVELVYQAVECSPDGLLQVPQIYTSIMNRYPYFRCMDRSALSSWRSSIRHALYQKWFRKIKFTSTEITAKGSYWSINKKYNLKEISTPKPAKRITRCYLPFHINVENEDSSDKSPEDFDLDPNTHSHVIALLTEEDEKDSGHNDSSNIQEVMNVAREFGFTLQTSTSGPVDDPDPILSSCQNYDNMYSNDSSCSSGNSNLEYSYDILSSPSPVVSPLIPEYLGMGMDQVIIPPFSDCYVFPTWHGESFNISNPYLSDNLSVVHNKGSDISENLSDVYDRDNNSPDIISDSEQLSFSFDREGKQLESADDYFTCESVDENFISFNVYNDLN